ncbi:MAG: hypothetical protein WC711_00140 [Candidatus Staskawiczbacteria bacterium]|jgi:hypothetical protein
MLNIKRLSQKNLDKVGKLIQLLFEQAEIQGFNEDTYGHKISKEQLKDNGIYQSEVESIIKGIECVEIMNELIETEWSRRLRFTDDDPEERLIRMNPNLIPPKIFTKHVFIKVKNVKEFKKLKDAIYAITNKTNVWPVAEFTNNVLYYQNKKIDFSNAQNQKDLLITLFKSPKKNWLYEEVQEDWDELGIDKVKYPSDYWRKFYTAGDGINTAIAIETGIKNFIIKDATRKGNIKINPKYI